jgi:hypothetical protein
MSKPTTPESIALREMWRAVVRGHWETLALVPADAGSSARAVSKALSEMSEAGGGHRFEFVPAEGASVEDGARLASAFRSPAQPGVRRVATVDPPVVNLAVIPLAMAADAVILVVQLGAADQASVRNTLDIVGHQRVLGFVAVGESKPP